MEYILLLTACINPDGMPFTCTIMSGGSSGQATVNIGLDYQKQN
jgi:hypothetical protein